MSEFEAKGYIDDIIHTLRIMRRTAVDQEKLTNYISALEIAYQKLDKSKKFTTKPELDQITIEDLLQKA